MLVRCTGKCKKEYEQNEENFYRRKIGGFYTVCKTCCRDRSLKYYKSLPLTKKRKSYYKPKKIEFAKRNTKEGFINYMKKNPVYFKETFNQEPTALNILEACRSLI